jgi:hypothetical protein
MARRSALSCSCRLNLNTQQLVLVQHVGRIPVYCHPRSMVTGVSSAISYSLITQILLLKIICQFLPIDCLVSSNKFRTFPSLPDTNKWRSSHCNRLISMEQCTRCIVPDPVLSISTLNKKFWTYQNRPWTLQPIKRAWTQWDSMGIQTRTRASQGFPTWEDAFGDLDATAAGQLRRREHPRFFHSITKIGATWLSFLA